MIYVTFALRRTGQHAIINWLAYQIGRPVLHFNDCHIKRNEIYPDLPGMVMFYDGKGGKLNFYKKPEEYNSFSAPEDTFKIYSFEEKHPRDIDEILQFFPDESVVPLMVIRDPYNWVAACLHRQVQFPGKEIMIARDIKRRIEDYKEYLKLSYEYETGKNNRIISINYNKWNSEKKYRDRICSVLGLENTDKGREEIEYFGHGSTFDGRKFDGQASKMKVSQRWKSYSENDNYWELFDTEIENLSRLLFNFVPTKRHE